MKLRNCKKTKTENRFTLAKIINLLPEACVKFMPAGDLRSLYQVSRGINKLVDPILNRMSVYQGLFEIKESINELNNERSFRNCEKFKNYHFCQIHSIQKLYDMVPVLPENFLLLSILSGVPKKYKPQRDLWTDSPPLDPNARELRIPAALLPCASTFDILMTNLARLYLASGCTIDAATLPRGITHLKLSGYVSGQFDRSPPNLSYLSISHFKGDIGQLPPTLRVLAFKSYAGAVDRLPPALEVLDLGSTFLNHHVDALPASLRKLSIGSVYNQAINRLPEGLVFFRLASQFPAHPNLPSTVREFHYHIKTGPLPTYFKTPLNTTRVVMKGVGTEVNFRYFELTRVQDLTLLGINILGYDFLPETLVKMVIKVFFSPKCFSVFPRGLKHLFIWCSYLDIPVDFLPENLTELYLFCTKFNQNIAALPDSIQKLYLPPNYHQPLFKLPYHIRSVYTSGDPESSLAKALEKTDRYEKYREKYIISDFYELNLKEYRLRSC